MCTLTKTNYIRAVEKLKLKIIYFNPKKKLKIILFEYLY